VAVVAAVWSSSGADGGCSAHVAAVAAELVVAGSIDCMFMVRTPSMMHPGSQDWQHLQMGFRLAGWLVVISLAAGVGRNPCSPCLL